ncbi:MAG: hypothetical protein ABWZ76_03660 [Acidimicrobiales bacterium]
MSARPLTLVALGLTLAAADARVVGVDALPDVVGWGLVALGAARLGQHRPGRLAALAAAAALADLDLPHRYESMDSTSGAVASSRFQGRASFDQGLTFEPLDGARLVLALLALVAGAAALWLLLGRLEDRARLLRDDEAATRLRLARWAIPLGWALPQLAVAGVQVAGGGGADPVWNGAHELLGMAGLAVVLVAAGMLAAYSNRGWTATDAERLSPWAEMMTAELPSGTGGY